MKHSIQWGLPPLRENIPPELKGMPRWVNWISESRGEKITKIPKNSRSPHRNASTNKESDRSSFDDAWDAYSSGNDVNGVGLILTDLQGYIFTDLDHVIDPDTGDIDEWAREIVERIDSYTEISPSGTGLHLIARADIASPDFNNHSQGIEMYSGKGARYLTITGHPYKDSTMEIQTVNPKVFQDIYEKYRTSHKERVLISIDMPAPDINAPDPGDIPSLSPHLASYLINGDASAYGDDGSAALFGAIKTLYNMGYRDPQVLGIILKSHGAMNTGLKRGKTEEGALKWIWKYSCIPAKSGVEQGPTDVAPPTAPEVVKRKIPTDEALLKPEGVLGIVVEYILNSSRYPQGIFAVGGAISLLSHFIGNNYRTEDGVYCNLYCLAIGPTGSGKDSPRKAVKRVMQEHRQTEFVSDSVASGPGIEDFLSASDKPIALLLIDEFGTFLQQHVGRNGDEHGIIGTLLKLFTAVDSFYSMRLKAGGPRESILHPFVSIYGTTTEGAVQAALTEGGAEAGWIGRILFLSTSEARPPSQEPAPYDDIPDEINNWIQEVENKGLGLDKGAKITAKYRAPAKRALDKYQNNIDDHLRSDTINPIARAALVRMTEMIKKIALISAVSRNPLNPAISIEDVNWAIAVASYSKSYVENTLTDAIEGGAAVSLETRQINKCLDTIKRVRSYSDSEFKAATKKGFMPKRMLQKKMAVASRTFQNITLSLIESGQITQATLTKEEHGINCAEAYFMPHPIE